MATQAFITHITQASACCVQVSPNEYLETALQPVKGPGRSVEAKNAVSHSSRISLCQKQERQEKWSCKGLPPSTRRFTVFQSPHIDKKSREQFLSPGVSILAATTLILSLRTTDPPL